MKIITFTCQTAIFVYYNKYGLLPRPPYKEHFCIEAAIQHMKERGIEDPEILMPMSKGITTKCRAEDFNVYSDVCGYEKYQAPKSILTGQKIHLN